jgi:hypothetical protein
MLPSSQQAFAHAYFDNFLAKLCSDAIINSSYIEVVKPPPKDTVGLHLSKSVVTSVFLKDDLYTSSLNVSLLSHLKADGRVDLVILDPPQGDKLHHDDAGNICLSFLVLFSR